MGSPRDRKLEEALAVVEKCRTPSGFRASAHLYPELWMRDLVLSEGVLLQLGHAHSVRAHFESFLSYQRTDGQLPTVVTAGWRRAFNQRFHFWTADTELLFLIGVADYARISGDADFTRARREQLDRCASFVMSKKNRWGLIPGADWRDAVPNFWNMCLLSNQVLLVDACTAMGLREEADSSKQRILDAFLVPEEDRLANGVSFRDGSVQRDDQFDSFGSSLAILNGTAKGRTASAVADCLRRALTPHGFRNMLPPLTVQRLTVFASPDGINAFARNGAFLRNRKGRYQNSTVWPFVEGRIVSALRALGLEDEASTASGMIVDREGLNEWYDPLTGRGCGSRDQLWTAAAVISQLRI